MLKLVVLGTAALACARDSVSYAGRALLATVPGLLAAALVAVLGPSPTRLRAVGWTLVGMSALAAVILIVGAR